MFSSNKRRDDETILKLEGLQIFHRHQVFFINNRAVYTRFVLNATGMKEFFFSQI